MANKTFKTRILLKYDSYTNWTTNNPVLKAGEVAIATIASGNTQKVNSVIAPQTLMKVGDGVSAYNDLLFVSALAADVYDWAKASVKPSYNYTEIGEYAEYRIAEADGNYKLQIRYGGKGSWVDAPNDSTTIPLAQVVSDLSALTQTVTGIRTDLGAKADVANADGSAFARIAQLSEDLAALKGAGEGGIDDMINDAIGELNMAAPLNVGAGETIKVINETNGIVTAEKQDIAIKASQVTDFVTAVNTEIAKLDATPSQPAGADGLALSITEVDGKITAISGSIAAGTYAPANVLADLDHDSSKIPASKAAGTEVTLISGVTQADGAVSTARTTLKFNQALSDDNLIATMDDVEEVATDLLGEINGSLHLKGVSSTDPLSSSGATVPGVDSFVTGDVILYTAEGITTEYVFTNNTWYKLGDESIASKLLAELDYSASLNANQTLKTVTQADGAVSVVAQDIAIPASQVTDFASAVKTEIDKLDATVSQASAETNGYVTAEVVETDGKLTSVSIDVDTSKYVMQADAAEWDLSSPTKSDATGAAVPVITDVTQLNGKVSATGATIQFNQALSSTNKAATMADVAASITAANLTVKEGAAVSVTADTVAVTAYKPTVGDNNVLTVQSATVPTAAGVKNAIDTEIADLKNTDDAVADQWVTAAVQSNGVVTVSRSAIKINQLAENAVEDYVIFDCGDSKTMVGA